MNTPEESTTDPQSQSDGGSTPNTYVDLLPETHGVVGKSAIPFHMTQSQKKRRKFIPFKYHSKIFKNSKKRMSKKGNNLSVFKGADPHKHGTRHAIEDNRISTSSSSYESCRPFKNNGSCHTYVDIDECHVDRDMDLERCNSISTVATLPVVSTPPTTRKQNVVVENFDRRQPTTPSKTTPKIHYEMKIPKGDEMKRYVILFCVVLIFIVLSTVLAGYVSTMNIPNEVDQKFKEMPQWELLNSLPSNLTEMRTAFQLGLDIIERKTIDKEHFQNFTKSIDFKNETNVISELVLQHFLNETDFLSWKDEVKKIIYTIIYSSNCVNNCTGQPIGNHQSCYTCSGYVSCAEGSVLYNMTCPYSGEKSPLLWDNIKRSCERTSPTCDPAYILY